MKTQLPSAIILCALLLVLSLHAFAAGNQTTHVSSSGTSHRASNASALLANALGTRYTGYTMWRARPISLPRRSCGRCTPAWP